MSNRPAGKALLEYGGDLNVEKLENALGDVDNEIECLRAERSELLAVLKSIEVIITTLKTAEREP